MARIMIENLFKKTLEVSDLSRTLLSHLHAQGVDWMHACGGKGRCTTCKAIIVEGEAQFAPLTDAEKKYAGMGALHTGERLACQARINGDVVIAVPAEYQLPHLRYSDES